MDALDLATGKLVWTHAVQPVSPVDQPTAAGGMVFVKDAEQLVALDAATGSPVWSHGGFEGASVIVQKGLVYAVMGTFADVSLTALNAETGAVRWATSAGLCATDPFSDGTAIYGIACGSSSSSSVQLVAYDPVTGRRMWSVKHGDTFPTETGMAACGVILVGDFTGWNDQDIFTRAIDSRQTHREIWKADGFVALLRTTASSSGSVRAEAFERWTYAPDHRSGRRTCRRTFLT